MVSSCWSSRVRGCARPAQVNVAEAQLRARWFGLGVVVGGRVVETGRTLNAPRYLPGNTSHSFTDRPAGHCHVQAEQPAQRTGGQGKDAPAPFLTPTVCFKGTFHLFQLHLL